MKEIDLTLWGSVDHDKIVTTRARMSKYLSLSKKYIDEGDAHHTAIQMAMTGVGMGIDRHTLEEDINRLWLKKGREPDPDEVEDIISWAEEKISEEALVDEYKFSSRRPRFPKVDIEMRDEVIKSSSVDLKALEENSPSRAFVPNLNRVNQGEYLILTQEEGALICAGSLRNPRNHEVESPPFAGRDMEYFCPNPMKEKLGVRDKDIHAVRKFPKNLCPRSNANVKERRYLVIESDLEKGLSFKENMDRQASIIDHLSQFRRLTSVTFSGNKSLHALFQVRGHTEESNAEFMKYSCLLGADKSMWTPSQMTRMPNGRRSHLTTQTLHYLNPTESFDEKEETELKELPTINYNDYKAI